MTVKKLSEKKVTLISLVRNCISRLDYLMSLRDHGAVVNTAIAISYAKGIVKNKDSNLLASNGGHTVLSKCWGKNLLKQMGFIKQRASTKVIVTI